MTWWLLAWTTAGLLALLDAAGRRPLPATQPTRRMPALPLQRWARPAAAVAGAAIAVLGSPMPGLLIGALLWWSLPILVQHLERTAVAAALAAAERQLPLVAGLLSACLASGSTLPRSLQVTAGAVPEPARDVLERAAVASELGAPAGEIATILAAPGAGWAGLGAAVVRSAATGAPLAGMLAGQADHAMYVWYAQASAQARSVAVRSVLPLALCYLPAFLLLGVAPVVAGLVGSLDLWSP